MSGRLGWLHGASVPTQAPVAVEEKSTTSRSATTYSQRQRDPNAPDSRLLFNQKCIYERRLPGDSYITAHVTRLQSGYYDSPNIHEDRVDHVRFVAINFVFHPVDTRHRFVAAKINLSIYDRNTVPEGIPLPPQITRSSGRRPSMSHRPVKQKPKFLRHAPHLLYGALSPETLDWNFNLTGSLGVTQGPANATLSPSGGVKSSYKIFKMMKIQGSLRTLNSWHGQEYDVEDGDLWWTLEENELQKSGLPREFTFVALFTKGDPSNDVVFEIDIEPVVGSWYGTYPKWWLNRLWYLPIPKDSVDIDKELGQRFGPCAPGQGFNFASLMGTFDDFVRLPGTTYSTSEPTPDLPATSVQTTNTQTKQKAQPSGQAKDSVPMTASPAPNEPTDLNIRVYLEGYRQPSPVVRNSAHVAHATHQRSSSSPVPPAPSRSPLPATGFSISKPRSRPTSALNFSSTPPLNPSSSSKQRPVSALYEMPSTTPPPSSNQGARLYGEIARPQSHQTGLSEDSFMHLNSPLSSNSETSPPPRSRSLRHSRSRSGLTKEYGKSAVQQPTVQPDKERQTQVTLSEERDNEASTSNIHGSNTTSPQPQSYTPSVAPVAPASLLVTSRRRNSLRSSPGNINPHPLVPTAPSAPPPSSFNPKRLSLAAAGTSDTVTDRLPGSDSNTNQNQKTKRYSFPPSSFPVNMIASLAPPPPTPPSPPPPPEPPAPPTPLAPPMSQFQPPRHRPDFYDDRDSSASSSPSSDDHFDKIESPISDTQLPNTYPPTSYTSQSSTRSVQAPEKNVISPSLANVDGIVQREVNNYLRMHPELYTRTQTSMDGSGGGNGGDDGSGGNDDGENRYSGQQKQISRQSGVDRDRDRDLYQIQEVTEDEGDLWIGEGGGRYGSDDIGDTVNGTNGSFVRINNRHSIGGGGWEYSA